MSSHLLKSHRSVPVRPKTRLRRALPGDKDARFLIDSRLLLQAKLDDELAGREAQRVAEALANNPEAQLLFSEMSLLKSSLAGNERARPVPQSREFYWSKVERAIAREAGEPGPIKVSPNPSCMSMSNWGMKTVCFKERFICPECGSEESESTSLSEALKQGSGMRRRCVCANCHFEIPAHLAGRWGGIPVEDARKEWREVYRDLTAQESAGRIKAERRACKRPTPGGANRAPQPVEKRAR